MSTTTRRPTRAAATRTAVWHGRPQPYTSSWEDRSACYNRPQTLWDGDNADNTAKAKQICLSCPVLATCLGDAMDQERSVVWSRVAVRGGLNGPDRVQLFLDRRDHGVYDAEEARLLALEARAAGRPVADIIDGDVSASTVLLARRLAGEAVPSRKPRTAAVFRGGTAKERAFARAQDILEWREAGMTIKAIAGLLDMGRETIKDVVRSFDDLAQSGDDPEEDPIDPRALNAFLAGDDILLSHDHQVLAIAEAVGRGMSYPQIDQLRGWTKGSTSSFVSRQRKKYKQQGIPFPVQPKPQASLTDEQVLEMREAYAAGGVTDLDLAIRYGTSRKAVGHVLNGKNYKHVGGPVRAARSQRGLKASREFMCGHAPNSRAALKQHEMEEAA